MYSVVYHLKNWRTLTKIRQCLSRLTLCYAVPYRGHMFWVGRGGLAKLFQN